MKMKQILCTLLCGAILLCCLSPALLRAGDIKVVPSAGQVWMDRNLDALRVATKSDDCDTYGSLYQWGRSGDGHQYRTSKTTTDTQDFPNRAEFIITNTSPYDWRDTQDNTLWQGEQGSNNPCPAGFRLPTSAEWATERASWSSDNAAGALASPLKLPVAGYRDNASGDLGSAGVFGFYWSSTVSGIQVQALKFHASITLLEPNYRALGFSVRCIQD